MTFVIVGYGRVGARTARILHEEGHAVVIVENNPDKVERAREAEFDVIEGDGKNESVLERAGVADAAAVAGLTGDPNVDFAACMAGKEYGCRVVMRISEDYREEIYDQYAEDVDELIYPERLGAAGAKTALLGGNFNAIGELTEGLRLTTVTVPAGAPVIGRKVNDIDLEDFGRIYAHGRGRGAMTIPLPGTAVEPGDHLALVVEQHRLDRAKAALLGESKQKP
ncbi:potassium transporter Trk [Halobellus salinus]|uniref:Potassium transporter Trk n=1 Tax=Halobellus salinus TaxID=931585 RepID=A0A830EAZ5_9EURY|nr:TrkA family potassium uptake protein [Halobellus salinus]GGI94142.1 potassium transporter Trk [Halobellus salinus]SMP19554.1 trk system potassium uptake protein TrkA [Halobellus salinus]